MNQSLENKTCLCSSTANQTARESCHKFLIFRSNWLWITGFSKIDSLPQTICTFLWDLTKENATVTIVKSALQYYYILWWQSSELCQLLIQGCFNDSKKSIIMFTKYLGMTCFIIIHKTCGRQQQMIM